MSKPFKDSLPWLVPSAAIVIGAASLFVTGNPWTQQQSQQAALQLSESNEAIQTAAIAAALEEMVARQSTLTEDFSAVAPEPAPVIEQAVAAPEPVVAAAPPAPAPRPANAFVAQNPVFTGGNTQGANAVCIDDLKKLTAAARVYFPSGGLTAEQAGIENAHIIALIAQDCPGVQIRVQGHSDPSGDPETNLRLSKLRAEAVITRIAASGADTGMFIAEGLGDRVPSGLSGPQPTGYYDRRVEFTVEKVDQRTASIAPLKANPFASAACVKKLAASAQNTALFYAPRSVSLHASDVDIAMNLAEEAVSCPHARLRIVGHHAGDVQSGETPATARLRAKALMAMLVARGMPSGQIIIASPSVPWQDRETGMPGSRVSFDIILEDG